VNNNRISELESEIKAAKSVSTNKPNNYSKNRYHLLSDLIAGLTVGSLLGYNLDVVLNTKPLFLFLFIVLGACGGFYNFYKLEIKKHAKK